MIRTGKLVAGAAVLATPAMFMTSALAFADSGSASTPQKDNASSITHSNSSSGQSSSVPSFKWELEPGCYDKAAGTESFTVSKASKNTDFTFMGHGIKTTKHTTNANGRASFSVKVPANEKRVFEVDSGGKDRAKIEFSPEKACSGGNTGNGTVSKTPKGSVNTGGGATAGMEDPALLGAGSGMLLLGAGAAAVAMMRRRSD
jgi:hypothetical protein